MEAARGHTPPTALFYRQERVRRIFSTLMVRVPPRPGVAHLQKLTGHIRTNEIVIGFVIQEKPVDFLPRFAALSALCSPLNHFV